MNPVIVRRRGCARARARRRGVRRGRGAGGATARGRRTGGKRGVRGRGAGKGSEACALRARGSMTNGRPAPPPDLEYKAYADENDLPIIMDLVASELSEPYSIFTYRYFIASWPGLCWMAYSGGKCVGAIVCKLDDHRGVFRGYIAMLVVTKVRARGCHPQWWLARCSASRARPCGGMPSSLTRSRHRGRRAARAQAFRKYGIGTELVKRSLNVMREAGADECVLEAEVTNRGALALYQQLGFIRDKFLIRYYLNGVDAFRLKLLLPQDTVDAKRAELPEEQRKRIGACSRCKQGRHAGAGGPRQRRRPRVTLARASSAECVCVWGGED